jgi:CBS domain-containing protein
MSLENDLQQEQVIHLDINKFTEVESGTSVRDTVSQMRTTGCNCAIIKKDGQLTGIFTDRDLLRKVVDAPETWDNPIDALMTPSPITVKANDPAYAALDLMDEKHFRNVPVIDTNGKVIGNLTHYAVIKYLADRFPSLIYNLPPDTGRITHHRDGA